jgi:predicted phosphodiesterase
MKIQVLSDLHLEFYKFNPTPVSEADVVVLAGDIANGCDGIIWARECLPNQEIIYVPGNHEFYGHDRPATLKAMRSVALTSGVHLLDCDDIVIGDVRFLGATLWTDFCLFGENEKILAMESGARYLNDFRHIRDGQLQLFTTSRSVELFNESINWLSKKLDESFNGKTIVVSHHLPSILSVVDRYKNDLLSTCFASNLDHLFGKMDLWIHGHTHHSLDYEFAGTRVICNPQGYVSGRGAENPNFNPYLVIEP